MTTSESRSVDDLPRLSRGARIGTMIGFTAWIVPTALLAIVTGSGAAMAVPLLGMLAISVALAFGTLVGTEMMQRTCGDANNARIAMFGLLAIDIGALLFLFNVILAPRIEENPEFVRTLRSVGTVYRTSNLVPLLVLTVGILLVVVSITRTSKNRVHESS